MRTTSRDRVPTTAKTIPRRKLVRYDFNLGLLQQCVKLVSVLTYNEFSIERLTTIGTAVALLDALAAHQNDEEFVVDSMLSISNLVTVQANQEAFTDRARLKTTFELLAAYDDNADVVKFVLITLVRLAADDEMSKMIAEDGMGQVMHATEAFVDDAEVLKLIFELLGQLAFVGANNRALVSAGGIKVLLHTMETFDHDPDLIVKTITTLDNLVSAELEYASIILEKDGEGLLKRCIEKWSHEERVVQTGQTALLSIQAMLAQKEKGRTNRAALFARLGDDMDVSKLKTQKLQVRRSRGNQTFRDAASSRRGGDDATMRRRGRDAATPSLRRRRRRDGVAATPPLRRRRYDAATATSQLRRRHRDAAAAATPPPRRRRRDETI